MSDSDSIPSRPPSPLADLPTARPYRFNWDPTSRRPGPPSVSATTEGRGAGDHFSAQPRLAFLNNSSSLSLQLGALPQEWSSSKHGFHAISTVLNNPHKRQAPPKAHSALPPVVPADLPRVRRKDFDSYLRAIAPEWERFEHNTELGREGVAQVAESSSTPRASLDDSQNTGPIQLKSIPPLDSVPPIFFQSKFNLGDPRTFNAVTDSSDSEISDPLLLEKFSHYADTVEQHLILEISRRSTSFFAALTNLHELQSESEQCLTRIARLRSLLTNLDDNSAKRGLQVVRREATAANLAKVTENVKMVAGVVEMGKVARGLVGAGQWGEALGIIEEMERLWEGPDQQEVDKSLVVVGKPRKSSLPQVQEESEHEKDEEKETDPPDEQQRPNYGHRRRSTTAPPIPLSSLHAYASLPESLRVLTLEIAASLSSELVAVLRADLVERIAQGRDRFKGIEGVAWSDQGLRDRLKPLLQGLVRTKGVKEGLLSWREVVLGEVRGVVKARLPAIDAVQEDVDSQNSNQNSRAGLANHLRNMQHPDFLVLMQELYLSFLNAVEGLQEQGRAIIEILDSVSPSQKVTSATTPESIQDDLADILSSATELSNTQAARVISLRADQHATLDLAEFLVFFNESWGFVVKCEIICRRMIVGLRGVVVSQAKVFLQAFHQARITQSAKLVEDEQWNPAEVSPSLQRITDVLVDSAVRDAPELIIKSDADTLFPNPLSISRHKTTATNGKDKDREKRKPSPPPPPPTRNGPNGFNPSSVAGSKHLRIDERTYFAVSATAEVLVLLLDYLRVVVNLSLLTTDTMSRVIEFLKAFNSRTCQVVLGAGAMRSAGLKNITAKHLALASQSLSIMFELIPYVRETFRRHLSPKQAVMLVEFDKLKRDYQEHQNEIHSKLIAIMGDRLNAHIKTLQGVDWNIPKPGGGVNDYLEVLVKETVTLHKVLSRYLSIPVVEYVMTQVFAAINHGLSEEFGKIELPHQQAKDRLLADARYLHQKLSGLKNVGPPSGMLMTVVSEKSIPRPANMPPTPPPRSSTFGSSTNQRLKGLLSGRSPTFDKVLPSPVHTPSPPPQLSSLQAPASVTPLPPLPRTSSPEPIETNKINGDAGGVGGAENRNGALAPIGSSQDIINPALPIPDLGPAPASQNRSLPTQTGERTTVWKGTSPPASLLLPEVPPAITSPGPDSDSIEERVMDAPASGVLPLSVAVQEGDGTDGD